MRICFVMLPIEFYSPVSGGAIATVTMNVAKELLEQGHYVEIIAPSDGQPMYPVGRVHGIPQSQDGALKRVVKHLQARVMSWDSGDYGQYWSSVRAVLASLRPDAVVLANDIESAPLVKRASSQAVVVSWLHNECRFTRRAEAGLRGTDVFLACSHYIRRWFLSSSKVDPSSVHTAHAGVDPALFFPEEEKPKNPLRLLYVGRLDPNKGVDAAIDAFRILKERNLSATLTVAGGGWFYKRKNLTEERFVLNLSKSMERLNVEWLGHVPRRWLPEVVRRHDIALVLSRSQEPFGLVVLEAMSSGVAVLASPHGGLSESCGEAGVLANPDRPNEVADVLEDLASHPDKLRDLKQKSVRRARRARWIDTAEVLVGAIRETRKR